MSGPLGYPLHGSPSNDGYLQGHTPSILNETRNDHILSVTRKSAFFAPSLTWPLTHFLMWPGQSQHLRCSPTAALGVSTSADGAFVEKGKGLIDKPLPR
jgi:hypothetical protein